jgi:hypothetical protein
MPLVNVPWKDGFAVLVTVEVLMFLSGRGRPPRQCDTVSWLFVMPFVAEALDSCAPLTVYYTDYSGTNPLACLSPGGWGTLGDHRARRSHKGQI